MRIDVGDFAAAWIIGRNDWVYIPVLFAFNK